MGEVEKKRVDFYRKPSKEIMELNFFSYSHRWLQKKGKILRAEEAGQKV